MAWENNIWKEMEKMQRKIDGLFGSFWPESKETILEEENYRKPFADFRETEKEFIVQVEIPGVDKEDIKLHVIDGGIEIRAEKKREEKKDDKENYSYKEYAGFYQSLTFPENADLDNLDASYKNGLLTVKAPKKHKEKDKKVIQVK